MHRLWFRQLWFRRLLAASALSSLTLLWARRKSRRQPRQDPRRLVTEQDRSRKNIEARVQHRAHSFAETGESIPYALYVPPSYDASAAAPLLVALHGLFHEYDSLLTRELLDLACDQSMIIVAPLGYTQDGWYGAPDLLHGGCSSIKTRRSELDVMRVLRLVRSEFNVNPQRIYCFGFSMGGAGTLHLALRNPNLFAALGLAAPAIGVPGEIQPFTTKEKLNALAHVPTIVVQGKLDNPVPVEQTRQLVDDMRQAGMDVKYLELPRCGHRPPQSATLRELVKYLVAARKEQRESQSSRPRCARS